jgi:PAS domain S-box-containing protein
MKRLSIEQLGRTGFVLAEATLVLCLAGVASAALRFMPLSPRLGGLYGVLACLIVIVLSMLWLMRLRIRRLLNEIKNTDERMHDAHRVLESLLDNIPTMVFAKSADDLSFIRLNRAGEELLGYTRQELLGKSDRDFFPPEQAEFFIRKDREVLAQGAIVDIPAEEIDTRTHGLRILHTRKVPVRDEQGRSTILLGISLDITEEKQRERHALALNHELERNAKLLQSSNEELESFCYSVSHDLRAPLRAINGYAHLLQEQYLPLLDGDAARYLQTICQASGRMARLIDDLLELSRIGRQALVIDDVDMDTMVRTAVAEVLAGHNGPPPKIMIQPLLPARGDRRMLQQVWLNLIDNAIKYSASVATPTIGIWSTPRGNEIVYSVQDNGIGFDMCYYDKLFGVFQRLHAMSQYPGTGVGLAIVQRIVALHGGNIWAQAELGAGATFQFCLELASEAGVTLPEGERTHHSVDNPLPAQLS